MSVKRNYTLRYLKDGREVWRLQTRSIRRFSRRIQAVEFPDDSYSAYLRVSYGPGIGLGGRMENFYNDGEYKNKAKLLQAYKAFCEKETHGNQ